MKLGGTTVSFSSYSKHCRGHLRLEGHTGDPDSEPGVPRIGVRQAREYHMVGLWDSSLEAGREVP